MQLTRRVRTRTLWVRQQLVPSLRTVAPDPVAMTGHLVGLQGQEALAPYLSLSARIADFDPASLSDAIEQRRLVRMLCLRGTVHVLTPADALSLRPWVQPALERISSGNQVSGPARIVESQELIAAAAAALAGGPLPVAELGDRVAAAFPHVPAAAVRAAVRDRAPLVQVPPRGLWRRSGGVVYDLVTNWLAAPLAEPDPPELVRRYLRAFGPATAADMTKWSTVTRLGPVFRAMAGELVTYTSETGRTLYDIPGAPIADPELELPPLLLGNYDNLWLSHADRSHVTSDEDRLRWTGPNGGIGATVFLDGLLAGVWRRDADEITVTPFRRFTRAEQRGVDAEIARIRAILAR